MQVHAGDPAPLLEAGLLDDLTLSVIPVLLGDWLRFFRSASAIAGSSSA